MEDKARKLMEASTELDDEKRKNEDLQVASFALLELWRQ
jgi:hypothetical protein